MTTILKQVKLADGAGLPVAKTPLAAPNEWAPIVWAVAAHGGAGATSLSHAIEPLGDAGKHWPAADEFHWCAVVSRTTRDGLEAAHDAILQAQQGETGGCTVLGLVLVADAPGRLPKAVAQKLKVIERIVPQVWTVDYHRQWRSETVATRPQWSPLNDDDYGDKKKKRRRDLTINVPLDVESLGKDLVDLVRQLHKPTK